MLPECQGFYTFSFFVLYRMWTKSILPPNMTMFLGGPRVPGDPPVAAAPVAGARRTGRAGESVAATGASGDARDARGITLKVY